MKRKASQTPPPRAPRSILVFGALFVALGVVNLLGGNALMGIGFGAMGLAGLLGSPQAHALLGVDYARRWTAPRVVALVLVVISIGAFVALIATGFR